jgi:hypothetical protein
MVLELLEDTIEEKKGASEEIGRPEVVLHRIRIYRRRHYWLHNFLNQAHYWLPILTTRPHFFLYSFLHFPFLFFLTYACLSICRSSGLATSLFRKNSGTAVFIVKYISSFFLHVSKEKLQPLRKVMIRCSSVCAC